ncbi:hypothetical protein LXL04_023445 [Taraxacum kok-saghyz]
MDQNGLFAWLIWWWSRYKLKSQNFHVLTWWFLYNFDHLCCKWLVITVNCSYQGLFRVCFYEGSLVFWTGLVLSCSSGKEKLKGSRAVVFLENLSLGVFVENC